MERQRDTKTHEEALKDEVKRRYTDTHEKTLTEGMTWRDGETEIHMERH